jgi:DNA-binding response OmpR family regulator
MPEILLIEDDEFTLLLVASLLRDDGYEVITTADGPQGIELYSRRRPAVVVLDLGLPTMDGLQVLKRIREIDDKACVLVATGYPSEAAAKAAQALGVAGFLTKPFSPEVLRLKVRELIDGRNGG